MILHSDNAFPNLSQGVEFLDKLFVDVVDILPHIRGRGTHLFIMPADQNLPT